MPTIFVVEEVHAIVMNFFGLQRLFFAHLEDYVDFILSRFSFSYLWKNWYTPTNIETPPDLSKKSSLFENSSHIILVISQLLFLQRVHYPI